MRNPYNKHYYDYDEICVVQNAYELGKIMCFMMTFDINTHAFEWGCGIKGHKSIMVVKGDLCATDLKEARDACSGILWALRLNEFQSYIKKACKVLKF